MEGLGRFTEMGLGHRESLLRPCKIPLRRELLFRRRVRVEAPISGEAKSLHVKIRFRVGQIKLPKVHASNTSKAWSFVFGVCGLPPAGSRLAA